MANVINVKGNVVTNSHTGVRWELLESPRKANRAKGENPTWNDAGEYKVARAIAHVPGYAPKEILLNVPPDVVLAFHMANG